MAPGTGGQVDVYTKKGSLLSARVVNLKNSPALCFVFCLYTLARRCCRADRDKEPDHRAPLARPGDEKAKATVDTRESVTSFNGQRDSARHIFFVVVGQQRKNKSLAISHRFLSLDAGRQRKEIRRSPWRSTHRLVIRTKFHIG